MRNTPQKSLSHVTLAVAAKEVAAAADEESAPKRGRSSLVSTIAQRYPTSYFMLRKAT
jgi:hypothetical protein